MTLPPVGSGGPTREYRATATFLLGGLFTPGFLFVYQGAFWVDPTIRSVLLVSGVMLSVVALLVTAFGLASGRGWAVAVMSPLLKVLVLAGAIEVISALAHGTIAIPFVALLAVWALRAPRRSRPTAGEPAPRWGFTGALVIGAMLFSTAWPLVNPTLLAPGGPLVNGRDALQASLVVTCDSTPGSPPTFVQGRYAWSWSRGEPWPAGTDTISLSTYTVREDGLTGYRMDLSGGSSPGIVQSNIDLGQTQAILYGIDLGATRFQPQSVAIGLIAPDTLPTGHGSIEIAATYFHAPTDKYSEQSPALWHVLTQARCEW